MDTAAKLCITVVIGDVGARLAGGGDSLFRACITQSIGTGMLCGLRVKHCGWGHPVPIPLSPFNFMEARSAPIPPSFGKGRIHTYTPTPMKKHPLPHEKTRPLHGREGRGLRTLRSVPPLYQEKGFPFPTAVSLFFYFFFIFLFCLLGLVRLSHPRRSARAPSRRCGSPPAGKRPPTSRHCQPSRTPTHRS